MSDYPEHDKLKALNGHNQTVGQFLEWLSEQGIDLCRYDDSVSKYHPYPITDSHTSLMAKFFEIDENKLEAEKLAMLTSLRTAAT